jgi:PAS domain S-box-containing protein
MTLSDGDDGRWGQARLFASEIDKTVCVDLLRRMADRAPAAMVAIALPELRIVYANQAAHRAAPSQPADLVGQPADAALPFLDPGLIAAAARTGTTQRAPPACIAAGSGGATTWWDVSYTPLDPPGTGAATVLATAVDVTAHCAAAAEAQAARDMLDALLAYIPEGISISQGPDVRVAHISAQGIAWTGRHENELTGHSALQDHGAWEVFRPGTNEAVAPADRPLARATRTGAVTMNETLLIRRPDGSVVSVLCNSGPIRDAAGRVTGAVMAWRDIGELQAAQAALRGSEQMLRAVLMQIPAAIFIVAAPDGRLAFTSKMVDEVLGNPNHDMAQARANMQGWAVHPDGTPYELHEYPSRRALFDGETLRGEPMMYRCGDGRMIELEVYAGPVRSETGEVVAAIAAALDVTDRKDAAAKLRESEARLRVALEAGGLGTWEIDTVANTTHFGRSLAVMLGMPPEPVVWDRSSALSFLHPDDRDRVSAEFARVLASGDTYFCEFRARKTDGSTRWFVSHGRIIRAFDGSPLRAVGVTRDVTERRLREDRLREAAEARELLLREADHRIKNSLQLVGSLLGLQRSRLSDPDAVAALDGAMTRVMAISEAHTALHQSVDLRHIALGEMLRNLCAHVGTLNPSVTFVSDCPDATELDTERAIPLGLAISELLTNAAKHAYPSASGMVLTAVTLDGEMFEIAVSDTGVGMTSPTTSRGRLGSTIVRALVAQIGAEMAVTSAPGKGTRTVLRFPKRPPFDGQA